jgi:hypothetical protein
MCVWYKSYVQTVLKAVTLPAIPDMKDAISAVSPNPSIPDGKSLTSIIGVARS